MTQEDIDAADALAKSDLIQRIHSRLESLSLRDLHDIYCELAKLGIQTPQGYHETGMHVIHSTNRS